MIKELLLIEGVSDVQLVSYYLQKVYGWEYKNERDLYTQKPNIAKINTKDEKVEYLFDKDFKTEIILGSVGGEGQFKKYISDNLIEDFIISKEISSVMVVTDRDEKSTVKIAKSIEDSFDGKLNLLFHENKWIKNEFYNGFGEKKQLSTFLLIVPKNENGALEKVLLDAIDEMPDKRPLLNKVVSFIDDLDEKISPATQKDNKRNKAKLGTFFSISQPGNALRSFAIQASNVQWKKSTKLNDLFSPLQYLGKDKPNVQNKHNNS